MAKNPITILNEGNKLLDELEAKLTGVNTSLLEISKAARGANLKNYFDVKSPSDVNEKLKLQKTIIEQLNAQVKERDRLEQALNNQIAKNKVAQSDYSKELAKQRFETQQINKTNKQAAILNSELATEYQKLVTKMNQAGSSVQNLVAKKARLGSLSNKEQKELKESQIEYKKYRQGVLDADVAIDRFQRKVGNYGTAFSKARFAFRNFAGVFGVLSAGLIAKGVFEDVKQLDSLNKALEKVTGTSQVYAKVNTFLLKKAEAYGIEIKSLTKEYTKFLAGLKGTNLEGQKGNKIFDKVIKTSAALGSSQDETNGILNAFTQIISKGTVQAEELRGQLGDRLPGAFNIMARAIDVTVEELNDMLKNGKVIADKVLPKFADELEKTFGLQNVNKINTVVSAQNRLSNAWTSLIKNMEGSDGALSNAFIGILNAGSRFLNLISSINKRSSEYVDTIKKEQIELNTLVSRITEANISNKDRERLIDNLTKNYPFFLKLLGKEKTTNENLSIALQEVNELYIKRIALQSQQKNINTLLEKSGDRALNNARKKIEIDRELNAINIENKLGLDLTNKSFEEKLKLIKDELSLNAEVKKQGTRVVRNEEAEILSKLNAKYTIYNGGLGNAANLSKDLVSEQELMKQIESELGVTLEQLNELFGVNSKALKKNSDSTKGNSDEKLKALKFSKEYYEEIIKKLSEEQSKLATSTDKYQEYEDQILAAKEAIKLLKGELETFKQPTYDGEGLDQSGLFNNLELGFFSHQMDEEKRLKEQSIKDKIELDKEYANQRRELEGEIFNNAVNFVDTLFDAKIQKYDDEINKNNDYYAALLDNQNLSEEQRSAIEAERDRKETEIEKKKRKKQREAAIFSKIIGIGTVLAQSAAAAAAALAPPPVGLGPVLGATLLPYIIANGALQAATIAAQPIPAYKKGKKKGEGKDGIALLNDGGKDELKISEGGDIERITGRNVLGHVKKSDTIIPDADKFLSNLSDQELYNNLHKHSILSSISHQKDTLDAYLLADSMNKAYEKQTNRMIKAMEKNTPNIKLINNNSIADDLAFQLKLNAL